MQVDTSVAEADVGKLQPDMDATFTVDAFPGERFKGKVRQIRNAPQTLQNVVTYDAVIDVDNPDLELRPGMTANVTFVYDERDSVLRVAERGAALPAAAGAGAGGLGAPAAAAAADRRRAAARRRRRRRRAAGGAAAGGRRAAPAARRPIGARSGCCAARRRRRCACAPASPTAPSPRSRRPSCTRATSVVTDAEVARRRRQGGQPAGSGAFRRMF